MQKRINELQEEIAELKKRFEAEKSGLSASADELRELYEKKLTDLKSLHAEELKRLRED
jgi:septation ring formation regulator EzrA